MKALDLFCGAGGGSLGLEKAGVNVIGAIDKDKKACDTYKKNLNGKVIQADLSKISFKDIEERIPESKDIDLIIGCPPCQNFSNLRDTTPWDENEPKDKLLKSFIQRINESEPDYVLFENVRGILNTKNGEFMNNLESKLEQMGYTFEWDIVKAINYGVPQDRKRVIGFGSKNHEDIELPEKTEEEVRTVRDAIDDLPKVKAGENCEKIANHKATNHQESTLERIRNIPKNGGSRTDLDKELWLECHKDLEESEGKSGAESVYGRMRWDKPSPTITTQYTSPSCGRFIHPEQNRGLTIREGARLQTFPDNFIFPNTKTHAKRMIGNAVPPKLIEKFIKDLAELNEINL